MTDSVVGLDRQKCTGTDMQGQPVQAYAALYRELADAR